MYRSALWRTKSIWLRLLLLGIISGITVIYFQQKTAGLTEDATAKTKILQRIDERFLLIQARVNLTGAMTQASVQKKHLDDILSSIALLLNGELTAKTSLEPLHDEIIRSKLYDVANLLRTYRVLLDRPTNLSYQAFIAYNLSRTGTDKPINTAPILSREVYTAMVDEFFGWENVNQELAPMFTKITALFAEIKLDQLVVLQESLQSLTAWRTKAVVLLMLLFVFQSYRIANRFIMLDSSETGLKVKIDADKEKLENNIAFAEAIGGGDLMSDFKPDKDDPLGDALGKMRANLINIAESDSQRNWANEGMALFGEILRNNSSDIEELSTKIIRELVRYLDANQGSVFIINDKDDGHLFLELKTCYAWGKARFAQKTVELGEGLAGQAWQENEFIYVTDVPDSYMEITSGLGKANPTAILVMPLKVNEEIYGVIEVATFEEFPNYKIEFMKKLSETLASSLATMKVNTTTRELLGESQRKEEELRAAEEETRQNLEELQTTQEEMDRLRSQLESQLTVMDKVAIISKTDPQGNITYVNDLFCAETGYAREELIGQNHRIFKSGHQDDRIFKELWTTITSGKQWRGEIKNKAKDGSYHWEDSIISPITNKEGELIEYFCVRFPINEKKENEERMQEMNAQIKNEKKKNLAVLEGAVDGVISFDDIGKIEFFNKAAEEIWSMERKDAIGKSIDILFPVRLRNNGHGNRVEFTGNGEAKQISIRTEITTKNSVGKEINILATLSEANIDGQHFYTLFVQNISVDLF